MLKYRFDGLSFTSVNLLKSKEKDQPVFTTVDTAVIKFSYFILSVALSLMSQFFAGRKFYNLYFLLYKIDGFIIGHT